jgi:ADP-ribosylglycohydrolase
MSRALISLEGLATGDACGDHFRPIGLAWNRPLAVERAKRSAPWRFTDDTQMALSIVTTLRLHGEIDQDDLALSFGRHYDISRGYGPAMHELLPAIRSRRPWRAAAKMLFGGSGSFGNGSAMRVAPLGAYFADEPELIPEQAARSAEVTHAHPEALAGAIAVALAAACAWRQRESDATPSRVDFLEQVIARTPESAVRRGLEEACDLPADATPDIAAIALGNGSRVTCPDTVPYCLWVASGNLRHWEEAFWQALGDAGDRDTACAIVGGVVASGVGMEGIPPEWRDMREPLPQWGMVTWDSASHVGAALLHYS